MFRCIGDYLHLFGVIVVLGTLYKNKSCRGISRGTHILFLGVFASRYLDLFYYRQSQYLVVFKLTYMITACLVLAVFWKLDHTYERKKDTCSLMVLLMPCVAAALLLAQDYTIIEVMWSFSQFLEGVAMVPQYIFCYRGTGANDIGVALSVMSLGGYRLFYVANWVRKRVQSPEYFDAISWIGGFVEISFFFDYLLSIFTGASLLKSVVLKVDKKVIELPRGFLCLDVV
eukprot:CAMPEP_0176190484 /NCGR_PEP_ID=MMETSP0121_2-20121125/3962_1 /TAXON_ID=160619 /ORGANISM="Kryptoperidinium foliaceum, Strain CCMP 1326" /LENGTH=228 /DNA_ID=CAMNT_0017529107 /DNA_START=143 /DNA_END=829 /DNA_ORIENTATION=+